MKKQKENRFLKAFGGFLLLAFLLANSFALKAQINIGQWLTSNTETISMPVFAQTPNVKGDTFALKELFSLTTAQAPTLQPFPGMALYEAVKGAPVFQPDFTLEDGFLPLEGKSKLNPSHRWLNIYLETSEYSKTKLEFFSPQLFEVFINGEKKASKYNFSDEKGKVTLNLPLPKGKHQILVKTITTPADTNQWKFKGVITPPSYAEAYPCNFSTSPKRIKVIEDIYRGIKISNVAPSFDGQFYTIGFRRHLPGDKSENWTEVRRTRDQSLAHHFRHASVSQISWSPVANQLAFVNTRERKSTLFIFDLSTLQMKAVLEDMENFAGYRWAPDASYIIYFQREEAPKQEGSTLQVLNLSDRLPGFRSRTFIYQLELSTLNSRRLTFGNLSTSLHDIAPDGKKLLISQSRPDFSERPYSVSQYYILDLEQMKADTLFKDRRWGISCSFSPDGKKLLVTGGPSAFGSQGLNVPEGTIPNNYDTQAYIYDLATAQVEAITREFDPSVQQAVWNKADNTIYVVAQQGDRRTLYRYDFKKRAFSPLQTNTDITQNLQFAQTQALAMYLGESITTPQAAYSINLKNLKVTQIENTEKENYKNVVFGETKEWDYVTSKGVSVQGRVYYPVGFNPDEKYPVIVYYYGGTTPVQRGFGGRYPFNIFTSQGYLVYVLQPSGSIGYGQAFSAAHVNNWGITVADEIIESSKAFLAAHPFANAEKVGCIGASYGGFMTMLLQTRTDMFAAAISHAGISNIASYWGVGYWGVGYSSEATAESFPWNRPDIYVEQSPLYQADRIKTPLLLLHGDVDTNVPPGESLQMFAALQVLNKPVELVLIKGEDHQIVTPSKRIEWHNTIMAWFDRYLKDKPQWWNDLYPKGNF